MRVARIGFNAAGQLLTIQRDGNAGNVRTIGANDIQRFTDGGAGADHIINDQNLAALQRGANQGAAFAMVLGLFAVVGQRQITPTRCQLDGNGRRQRNALIGRSENQIKVEAGVFDGIHIANGQLAHQATAVKQTGIEEIGRLAAGF